MDKIILKGIDTQFLAHLSRNCKWTILIEIYSFSKLFDFMKIWQMLFQKVFDSKLET